MFNSGTVQIWDSLQVWTNTCCSHQLHGQTPDEVDSLEAAPSGRVSGAVAAAIRKLQHELGIPAAQLESQHFVFLTRLLYCAADTDAVTKECTGWGEHELDYLLFLRARVDLSPNKEEVSDYRYVTPDKLKEMMAPESGLSWSPWFRIVAEHFLFQWWEDLDGALEGKHADWAAIHRLTC
jgi:isopentenyl-diphosphate Delta-isomerase